MRAINLGQIGGPVINTGDTTIWAELQPVIFDLRIEGINVDRLSDLAEAYGKLPEGAIAVLLSWLPRVRHPGAQEAIVRGLALSRTPYDGAPLAALFESTDSEILRWVIANTIAESSPSRLSAWLSKTLRDPRYGKSKEMLLIAAARLLDRDEALELIVPALSTIPLHATKALAEIGGHKEQQLLEERLTSAKGIERKEIERALRKMRRRLR